jgi:hypothetical protein
VNKLKLDVVLALVEAAHNIILGNVPLTSHQMESLRQHKKELYKLVSKKTKNPQKILILQKGDGLLSSILSPLASVLGGLFGGGRANSKSRA